MTAQRYFLKLSYLGTAYNGWQVQKNAPLTVQAVIEENLSKILRDRVGVLGCGRTDTGVHARDFYAHFDTISDEVEVNKSAFLHKLNMVLPYDIAIHDVLKVKHNYHARFDAIARTYKYYIHKHKDPFLHNRSYFYSLPLNMDKMNEACTVLFEYDDFSAFSKSNTQVSTNICKMMEAQWQQEGQLMVFTIKANRFLRNMVRAVVGTMMNVGREKMNCDDMRKIIEGKSRAEAGVSAPANGLYLHKVDYPQNYFNSEA